MKIATERVKDAVGKAREVYEALRLKHIDADNIVRSVDHLVDVCGDDFNTKIRILKIGGHPQVLGAFIKTSDATADICINAELNFCWQRFVVCKELFHALLDEEQYRTKGLAAHVEEMLLTFPVLDSQPSTAVVTEFVAEIAAMEFLFPYASRLNELVIEIGATQIAEKYKVPLIYVERFMSDDLIQQLAPFAAPVTPA